jgi:hypothetical protein
MFEIIRTLFMFIQSKPSVKNTAASAVASAVVEAAVDSAVEAAVDAAVEAAVDAAVEAAVAAAVDEKVEVLMPKELQGMTLQQWRSFIGDAAKPQIVDLPQQVQYTMENGMIVIIGGAVPPVALVADYSADAGYVEFSDKTGKLFRVGVTPTSISASN